MKIVILAGGSGTRLFPLSREELPKQFIEIFENRSLFQHTVRRALMLADPEDIYIVANEKHKFRVLDQLAEIGVEIPNILLEPVAKNTLPAVIYALREIGGDATVAVMPADHLIDANEDFIKAFKNAEKLADNHIVTFGVKPTHPHTGYGYIKPGKELGEGFLVERFIEKPNRETAEMLIREGCLWNSGIFVFSKDLFLEECGKHVPEVLGLLEKTDYISLPEVSIDKGVMEKTDKAAVIPLNTFWSDVGSFDAIYELYKKDDRGNAISGEILIVDSENNLAISERLLALVGVRDLAVIDTGDVVLVSSKKDSQKIRDIVRILREKGDKRVEVHRTAYRPWGSYTVLEEGQFYRIKRLTVLPKKRLSLQRHYHRSEHWVVVKGTAKVVVDDRELLLRNGESTFIRAGETHRLENPGMIPLEVIEVQIGEFIDEDDIERLEDDFRRD
ncbi:mannose-1-phosphate guanylyltransferase/mannose-6-phosphate isomerase [Archaeoglobus neptunius]|uniref:mannose-1-phosphate guanylyltransferase/mannose-6-phosphate isomerase n=1 Tax=Archaeoglobus neptunius TaxID=2798580 RepID=UPI001928CA9C